MTAAAVTILCKFLRQPVVLGYLIAGFLVGPHVPWVPTITDMESIKVWAEMGVIFLLFSLGLEFSFKKLVKVGGPSTITAMFEIVFMLVAGFFTGQILGWSRMDSLFLGGILSISSTTIIVRAFDELGLKKKGFTNLVFGVLIVEDLVAILLLVLLSTVAATQTLSGTALITSSVQLGFFLITWFLVGIYLLPGLLNRLKPWLSNETTLIVSLGLCLMMVLIATHVGFSPALGAFVMGSLLAETREGHRIEELLVPVRDLFAAIFFVSVGMLLDPQILWEHGGVIILLTIVTIIGKFLSSATGALVSGQSLKTSIQAGMSLAQIGEFSFIIATLGMTLGVTNTILYPIAVAVSAITTFTTPYQIKYSGALYRWVEKKLSPSLLQRLERYESAIPQNSSHSVLSVVWREYGMKMILNGIIVVGISLVATRFLQPFLNGIIHDAFWTSIAACSLSLLASAPFMWAIIVGAPGNLTDYDTEVLEQLKKLQFGISVVRILVGGVLTGFVMGQFASLQTASGIMLLALSTVGIIFSRYSEPIYRAIENTFLTNLNEKEREELAKKSLNPELAPWQASLSEYTLSPHSPLVAKSLQESQLKEKFGVTIAMIQRGNRRLLAPGRSDLLLPHDRIFLIGSEDQLSGAQHLIEQNNFLEDAPLPSTFGLDHLTLNSGSPYIGRTIRDSGLRDHAMGLIVGLEREGRRLLSPDSALTLLEGDHLWIVGDRTLIADIKKSAASLRS